MSGETSNSEGDADASNAAVERVDDPSELKETKDTPGVTSEGCERGASKSVSVGHAGHGIGPVDSLNELMEFAVLTVEPYVENGEMNAHVCLGGTCWCADDVDGPGRGTDELGCQTGMSSSQVDAPRAQMDAPSMLNKAETDVMDHGDGVGTYLSAGDLKHTVVEVDGIGSQMDASTGCGDDPSIETNANIPTNATEIDNMPQKKTKPPDSPSQHPRRAPNEPNGLSDQMDGLSVCMDAHSIETETETAGDGDGDPNGGDRDGGDRDGGDRDGMTSGSSIDSS